MSESLTECPYCGSTNNLKIIKEYNPDTIDMNMYVTMRCAKCESVFNTKVPSHHYQELRKRGRII